MRELPRSAHRDRHTRTDPAYAPNAEVFDGLAHDEIFRGVQAMDPGLLSAGAQSWQATATGLGEAVDQAHTEIRGAIADGWRGSAASNAAATVAAFELHGRQLAEVMAVVAQRLERAAEAAETLRAAVGAPSPAQPDLAAALLDPAQATANVETQKAVEGERLDVVRAMDTVYVPAFLGTGVDVPAFPDSAVVGAAAGPTGSQGAGELAVAAGDPGSTVAAQAAVAGTTQGAATVPASVAPPTSGSPVPTALPADGVRAGGPASGPAATVPARATGPATTPAAAPETGRVGHTAARPGAAPVPPPTGAGPIAGAPRPGSGRDRKRDGAEVSVAADTGPVPRAGTDPGHLGRDALGTSPSDAEQSGSRARGGDREESSAVGAGAGAGAIGGMLGGALAAGDTTRPGSSAPAHTARADRDHFHDQDDEDDEPDWAEEDFVFDDLDFDLGFDLGFEGGDSWHAAGAPDPATPPVVGDWTERE